MNNAAGKRSEPAASAACAVSNCSLARPFATIDLHFAENDVAIESDNTFSEVVHVAHHQRRRPEFTEPVEWMSGDHSVLVLLLEVLGHTVPLRKGAPEVVFDRA